MSSWHPKKHLNDMKDMTLFQAWIYEDPLRALPRYAACSVRCSTQSSVSPFCCVFFRVVLSFFVLFVGARYEYDIFNDYLKPYLTRPRDLQTSNIFIYRYVCQNDPKSISEDDFSWTSCNTLTQCDTLWHGRLVGICRDCIGKSVAFP